MGAGRFLAPCTLCELLLECSFPLLELGHSTLESVNLVPFVVGKLRQPASFKLFHPAAHLDQSGLYSGLPCPESRQLPMKVVSLLGDVPNLIPKVLHSSAGRPLFRG